MQRYRTVIPGVRCYPYCGALKRTARLRTLTLTLKAENCCFIVEVDQDGVPGVHTVTVMTADPLDAYKQVLAYLRENYNIEEQDDVQG